LSGQGGSFTEEIIKEMAKNNYRPIIMALSNPTSKSECSATQAYVWSNGKCIFASGSPFDPVICNGKMYVPGQGNNMYVFPGLGLGAVVSQAKKVTDGLFLAAAKTLASCVTDEELDAGQIFPSLYFIRSISTFIANSVCQQAVKEGLSRIETKERDWTRDIHNFMWDPRYQYD
jgi:malate dehydrogenase (oxaloacetate-decarboxylating)(NADP+)